VQTLSIWITFPSATVTISECCIRYGPRSLCSWIREVVRKRSPICWALAAGTSVRVVGVEELAGGVDVRSRAVEFQVTAGVDLTEAQVRGQHVGQLAGVERGVCVGVAPGDRERIGGVRHVVSGIDGRDDPG
jgi:hypothetical protein